MQLFAYAKSNTFYLGLTVIRYQILMGYYNFFFSMGPRYTRSLTNTISSTPMKINSKFFYLKFN